MPKVHFVKAARKDYPEAGISKGDSYWWWQFRNSDKNLSKSRPIRSQLTQSPFLISIYDIEDRMHAVSVDSDINDEVDGFKGEIRALRDGCEESLCNIPDHLQESPVGELLQERISSLGDMVWELEDIELDEVSDYNDRIEAVNKMHGISYQGS